MLNHMPEQTEPPRPLPFLRTLFSFWRSMGIAWLLLMAAVLVTLTALGDFGGALSALSVPLVASTAAILGITLRSRQRWTRPIHLRKRKGE